MEYNKEHGITPKTINKGIRDIIEATKAAEDSAVYDVKNKRGRINKKDLEKLIEALEGEMKDCAKSLQFERAAQLRDEIINLKEKFNGV